MSAPELSPEERAPVEAFELLGAHDHSGERMVWCVTHQHEHISSVPRFTYMCKSCGFGQWHKPAADAHEASCPGHETYEVEHVMVPTVEHADVESLREQLAEAQATIARLHEWIDTLHPAQREAWLAFLSAPSSTGGGPVDAETQKLIDEMVEAGDDRD